MRKHELQCIWEIIVNKSKLCSVIGLVLFGATGAALAAGPAAKNVPVDAAQAEWNKTMQPQRAATPRATPEPASSSFSFTVDTTGQPTYGRAFADCSGLSSSGNGVAYVATPFQVSAAGSYTILSEQSFDGFIFLYTPSFDPANALTNCVIGGDDFTGTGDSQIVSSLNPGTNYVLVSTAFSAGDAGTLQNTITGPGTVSGIGSTITKTIDSNGVPVGGGNVNFLLVANNSGSTGDTGVVATDTLPAGMSYVSDTCGGSAAGSTWTWNIGALAAAATANCTLTVSVSGTSNTCPAVNNSISLTTAGGRSASASATNSVENIGDPSFEEGNTGTTWTQAGNSGSPVCDASCGASVPRTGSWWIWFGGWDDRVEVASVAQTVTIPTGATALTFWVQVAACSTTQGTADFARLTIDGTEVWREDATSAACGETAYRQVSIPLSAGQANGAPHALSFESTQNGTNSGDWSNFFIDDVSIQTGQCALPDAIFENGFEL